jgi:peptidoglycan/LPS O-acetylase OafA/YrhL
VFYLRHLFSGTFSTGVGILVIIGLFAVTLLGGWLLHSRVEQPMMRRWSRAQRSEAPVSAAAPASGSRSGDEAPGQAA